MRLIYPYSPGTRFTNDFPRNSNSGDNSPCCNSVAGHQIAISFCICHDSTVVMPCTKLYSDHCIRVDVKRNFHPSNLNCDGKTVPETGPRTLTLARDKPQCPSPPHPHPHQKKNKKKTKKTPCCDNKATRVYTSQDELDTCNGRRSHWVCLELTQKFFQYMYIQGKTKIIIQWGTLHTSVFVNFLERKPYGW